MRNPKTLRDFAAPNHTIALGTRAGLAGIGLLLVLGGGTAAFVSDNSGGAAALVASGTALIALGAFANSIKSLEAAGVKVEMDRAVASSLSSAASTLEAAATADSEGRHDDATRLRQDASRLLDVVRIAADEYEAVRATSRPSSDRTRDMSRVVNQLRRAAPEAGSSAEVADLFAEGSDGRRLAALVLMATDPGLATDSCIMEAIRRPRSNFEQYHALRALEAVAATSLEKTRRHGFEKVLLEALEVQRFGDPTSDRSRLASRILKMLDV